MFDTVMYMIHIPAEWKQEMTKSLSAAELSRLQAAIQNTPTRSARLHPKKITNPSALSNQIQSLLSASVPWCPHGRYLTDRVAWSTTPEFAAGAVYPQEASSMSIWHVFTQLNINWEQARILDACAAPGGKSTAILDFLDGRGLLVSNDIDPSRASILRHNIGKWGYSNCVVTNNHPKDFQSLNQEFDVAVIDAPCSGEGLWRKTPAAVDEWSMPNVEYCALRQRDIVRDILPSVQDGGFIVYSTCTYNQYENEDIIQKMKNEFGLQPITISWHPSWGVAQSDPGCAHFYPHKTQGEGLFVCVLQKVSTGKQAEKDEYALQMYTASSQNAMEAQDQIPHHKTKHKNHKKTRFQTLRNRAFSPKFSVQKLSQNPNFLKTFFDNSAYALRQFREDIFATRATTVDDVTRYSQVLKIIQAGLHIGKLSRKGSQWILQPHIDLAFSIEKNVADIPTYQLSWDQFTTWLDTGTVQSQTTGKTRWMLLTYNCYVIGWAKV